MTTAERKRLLTPLIILSNQLDVEGFVMDNRAGDQTVGSDLGRSEAAVEKKRLLTPFIYRAKTAGIVIVVVVFLVVGALAFWRSRQRGGAGTGDSWEEHWIKFRQKAASGLQDTLERGRGLPGVDGERYERAIAVLGNRTYDDEVVLYECVAWPHNVYGQMLEIGFVDECAHVAALRLRGRGQTEYPALIFEHSGKGAQERRRKVGIRHLRHPLRRGSDDTQVLREREKADEPYSLCVASELYDSIVGGDGGVVLIGAEGEILDELAISKGPSR